MKRSAASSIAENDNNVYDGSAKCPFYGSSSSSSLHPLQAMAIYSVDMITALHLFLQFELKEHKTTGSGFLRLSDVANFYAVDNKQNTSSSMYAIAKGDTFDLSRYVCYCPPIKPVSIFTSDAFKGLYHSCLLLKIPPSQMSTLACQMCPLYYVKRKDAAPSWLKSLTAENDTIKVYFLYLYINYAAEIYRKESNKYVDPIERETWWPQMILGMNKLVCYEYLKEDIQVHAKTQRVNNDPEFDIYSVTRYTRKWRLPAFVSSDDPSLEYVWYDKCPCHNCKTCPGEKDNPDHAFYNHHGMMISSKMYIPARDPTGGLHLYVFPKNHYGCEVASIQNGYRKSLCPT